MSYPRGSRVYNTIIIVLYILAAGINIISMPAGIVEFCVLVERGVYMQASLT